MGGFMTLVLVFATAQLLWSFFAGRKVWRGWRLWLACLFFSVLDLGLVWLLMRHMPGLYGVNKVLLWGMVLCLVAQTIFNGLVTSAVVIRFILRRARRVPVDFKRRDLLKRSFLYPLVAAVLPAYGGLVESREQVLREVEIPVQGLTAPEGYRIVQLSDVHLGQFFSVEDWRKLLQQAAGQGADVLAVTGDLFDDERMNEEAVQVLDSFVPSFPDGIYYIFGNHEHFRGVGQIKNYLAGTRINVLENAARQVPGKTLWFAGVDYPMRRDRFEADRQKMHRQAMAEVPEGVTAVLLAHHPECIDDGAESGVALTLTGHTHGGQFGIFGLPILPFFRYNRGLIKIGDSYGYVHSGNGSWFPCRIGCPPEIVTFTLVSRG